MFENMIIEEKRVEIITNHNSNNTTNINIPTVFFVF